MRRDEELPGPGSLAGLDSGSGGPLSRVKEGVGAGFWETINNLFMRRLRIE